jgi:type III secretion system YscQ/HrcQ family protein
VLSVQALRGLAALAEAGRPLLLLELHRAVVEPSAPEGSVALALRLQAGDRVGRATAWVEPQAVSARAPVLPGWLGAIPVETALVVARGMLRRAELCALRIGDAVTFDETPAAPGAGAADAAWLVAAGMDRGPRWLCRPAEADRWTVVGAATVRGTGRLNMGAMDGSDHTEVTADAGAATPIDAVPIEVTAVAGRATLTVRALAALAPGVVVALGRSPGGAVDLSANGVPFARGRLVDLDGELAVEVTELRAGGAPLTRP